MVDIAYSTHTRLINGTLELARYSLARIIQRKRVLLSPAGLKAFKAQSYDAPSVFIHEISCFLSSIRCTLCMFDFWKSLSHQNNQRPNLA